MRRSAGALLLVAVFCAGCRTARKGVDLSQADRLIPLRLSCQALDNSMDAHTRTEAAAGTVLGLASIAVACVPDLGGEIYRAANKRRLAKYEEKFRGLPWFFAEKLSDQVAERLKEQAPQLSKGLQIVPYSKDVYPSFLLTVCNPTVTADGFWLSVSGEITDKFSRRAWRDGFYYFSEKHDREITLNQAMANPDSLKPELEFAAQVLADEIIEAMLAPPKRKKAKVN